MRRRSRPCHVLRSRRPRAVPPIFGWRSLRCLACNGTRLPGKRRHLRIRQAGKRGHSSGKIKYWSLTTGETQASEVQRAAGVGLRLLGRQGNGLRMPNLACANRHWFARNRNGLRQPRMICADEQAPNSAQCKPNSQARPRKALRPRSQMINAGEMIILLFRVASCHLA